MHFALPSTVCKILYCSPSPAGNKIRHHLCSLKTHHWLDETEDVNATEELMPEKRFEGRRGVLQMSKNYGVKDVEVGGSLEA